MMSLKEMFRLSDRGARDLKKGVLACTLTNLSLMLSVVVTVQIFAEVLRPLTGGAVSWSKMWMLFGAGIKSRPGARNGRFETLCRMEQFWLAEWKGVDGDGILKAVRNS